MPEVREVLADRYELLEVLGRGGMGVVFRARDRVLERVVAVKVLASERAHDEIFVARFEREARAAAGLNHPNIATVFDTGRAEGNRFIVMECVPGCSLAELLKRDGPLPPARAAEISGRIASALDAAHSAGIIHRDVKPANVMVDGHGRVKVLDFGIARAVDDASLTQTAIVLGSASYLAPEVALGRRADERSDVYSLGCLLYELLTGRPPFRGDLPAAVLHQHTSVPPDPPRELNPGIPKALDVLVLRMLAKSPSDRPQTARQVAEALDASTNGFAPPVVTDRPTAAITAPTQVLAHRRPPKPGRRAVLAIAAGLVCLALVLVLVDSSSPRHRSSTHAAQTRRPRATTTHPRPSTTHSSPPPTTQPTHPAVQTSKPVTVASAAAELTRLAAQDLAAGTIDHQASQQILARLQDILNTYRNGNGKDTAHKLDDFSKQIAQLSQHGDIQPAALPAINTAIDGLRSALARAIPATNPPTPAPGPHPGKHQKHPKPPKPPKH